MELPSTLLVAMAAWSEPPRAFPMRALGPRSCLLISPAHAAVGAVSYL